MMPAMVGKLLLRAGGKTSTVDKPITLPEASATSFEKLMISSL